MRKVLLFLIFSTNTHAIIDISEHAYFVQMISYQAKELGTLVELLTKTKIMSDNIQRISQVVDDRLYLVESTLSWAEDTKYLLQERPKDLADVNRLLRDLNSKKEDVLKAWIRIKGREKTNEFDKKSYLTQKKHAEKTVRKLIKNASRKNGNVGSANQHTAQNTAQTMVEVGKTNIHLIDLKKKMSQLLKYYEEQEIRRVKKEQRIKEIYK